MIRASFLALILLTIFPPDAIAAERMDRPSVYATGIREADGLAFGPTGDLFVAGETWLGAVYRVDQRGKVSVFAKGIRSADGIAIGKDGTIYVTSEIMDGRVAALAKDGKARDVARLRNPEGMAFDRDGVLYVTEDVEHGRVVKIHGGKIETVIEGLDRPENIAFDPAGNLYITETGTGHILRVDPGGRKHLLTDKISKPDGILYSERYGGFFVTQDLPNNAHVYHVSLDGGTRAVADGLHEPQGIAVGDNGDLYLTEQGKHRVLRILAGNIRPEGP